jgi:CRP/FNR family transcriptional regulator
MIDKTAEKPLARQVPHRGTALNLPKQEAVPAKISADRERSLVLRVGEALFRKGQPKTDVYRVEAGVVFTSSGGDDRSQRSFDMAEPGDFVGLGFLELHSNSAFAMTDCVVSSFSQKEFGELADHDAGLRAQEARGITQEFELRKAECVAEASRKSTAQRLAAYLLVVARMNRVEGREGNIIPESISCDFLTNLLEVSFEELSDATKELHKSKLIALDDQDRAEIVDFELLEDFASA